MKAKILFPELTVTLIILCYKCNAFTFHSQKSKTIATLTRKLSISSSLHRSEQKGIKLNGRLSMKDYGDDISCKKTPNVSLNAEITRRKAFASAFVSGAIVSNSMDGGIVANAQQVPTKIPISASWKAVDGLNSNDKIVSFDASAYKAMVDDSSRTPLFKKSIINRLNSAPNGPESQTVLDLGTGPFAVFAIMAAEAGAGKVYAIEGNPEAAASARATIKSSGLSEIITVYEGFSSDITLPAKADFAIAEIVGSIASEEGAYATILDAHTRLLKEPNNPNSWIPNRIQTYAAPSSYTLHNLFQPPEFDWSKLNGEPVRFNCRDEALQLMSNPILLEDITFSEITNNKSFWKKDITFTIDQERLDDNTLIFYDELRKNRLSKSEAEDVSKRTGRAFTGIAMWPRLFLDADEKIQVNSRSYPNGGHQKSHWQTVLPIMNDVPITGLKGGDEVSVNVDFNVGSDILKPPSYRLNGFVTMYN